MEQYRILIWILIILVVLAGIGFGIYYSFFYKGQEEAPSVSEAIKEEAVPAPLEKSTDEEGKEALDLANVALDNSDEIIFSLVNELSSHPQLLTWLKNKNLIRKFVVIVDNIAHDTSPRSHLKFLAPKGEFQAVERNGRFHISPDSYRRYNLFADVIASLNSNGCVRFYRQLKPLFQEAYQDLGYPDEDFNEALFKAIIILLKTPVIEDDIQLKQKIVAYEMTDKKLENLSPPQKHLIRMGADNVRKIQAKLREFALLLGIPESQLP